MIGVMYPFLTVTCERFLILSLTGLFFYILKSFITPLLFAAILVFLMYKPYKKLIKYIGNESISALTILLFIVIILTYPTIWVTSELIDESTTLFSSGKTLIENTDFKNCNTARKSVGGAAPPLGPPAATCLYFTCSIAKE